MYLKGVGPHRAEKLKKYFGIETIKDLLYNFPYRYVDRTKFYNINELMEGMDYIQLRGHITDFDAPEGEGRKRRVKAFFTDGTVKKLDFAVFLLLLITRGFASIVRGCT